MDSTHGSGAPTLALSGSLAAAAGQRLNDGEDYELQAVASPASGIESTKLYLNGDEADDSLENCPAQCSGDSDKKWLLRTDYFRGGEYLARLVSQKADGARHVKAFKFFVNDHPDSYSDTPPSEGAEERRAKARTFRTAVGLDAGEATLDRVLADSSLAQLYGTPLTQEEEDYVEEGQRLQAAAEQVAEYGERVATDSYGGLYVDYANGGVLYVGFKAEADRHLSEILRSFPFPTKIRSYHVDRTLTELNSLRSRIIADRAALGSEGVDVQDTVINWRDNVIEVRVPSPSQAAQDVLTRRYGPGARLTQGQAPLAAVSFLYAGLAISIQDGASGCTSNVPAFDGTSPRLITAGHCGSPNGVGKLTYRRNGSLSIGKVRRNTLRPSSNADALSTSVFDKRRVARRSVIVGSGKRKSLTGVQSLGGTQTGEIGRVVCKYGVTGPPDCGPIFETNDPQAGSATRPPGVDFGPRFGIIQTTDQRRATIHTCQGDSGGPVYINGPGRGVTIYGVTSYAGGGEFPPRGANKCRAEIGFTHIANAERALGVRVKTQRQR